MSELYHSSKHCRIYQGDSIAVLRGDHITPASIDMAICSPPYWGLRFYGTEPKIWDADPNCDHDFQARVFLMHSGRGDAQKSAKYSEQEHIADRELSDATCVKCGAWRGELGLEPTIDMFIDHLIQIFDAVKTVLKPTGTLWVNMGDTYAGSGGNNTNCSYSRKGSGGSGLMGDNVYARLKKRAGFNTRRLDTSGIPGKSLCMVPERFAIAMIERGGWVLRNKIIWHKPNVMPQSIKDRFTVDWEYLFFFSKQQDYYFETQYEPYLSEPPSSSEYISRFGGRIKRAVWTIPTQAYGDEHFAAYPVGLCKTPIQAGCPPNGQVLDPFCGTGATGEAALQLGRDFIGIDINPKFCELARKRLEKYIGQERLPF
jgi:site-specific DNA-methyltransferase (cytosine-N4-specific)